MDPYHVLGVQRTQPLDAIEARFRVLLHETHPDLHVGEGRAAVVDAERRTRLLTEAMAQIRVDYTRASGTGTSAFGTMAAASSSGVWVDRHPVAALAPTRERAPVPCPHCGEAFVQLRDYQRHLTEAHPATAGTTRRTKNTHARRRRRKRMASSAERALEVLALVVAVVAFAAMVVARNAITPDNAAWLGPSLAVGMVCCVIAAFAILLMRSR